MGGAGREVLDVGVVVIVVVDGGGLVGFVNEEGFAVDVGVTEDGLGVGVLVFVVVADVDGVTAGVLVVASAATPPPALSSAEVVWVPYRLTSG